MIELEILHHRTFIKSGPEDEIKKVMNKCKIVYYSYLGDTRKYEKTENLYDSNDRSFPTGYLHTLVHELDDIDFEALDERIYRTRTVILNSTEFEDNWESQNVFTQLIRKSLYDKEDGTEVNNNTGLIISPTGTGKSRFIEIIIDEKRTNTLILAPITKIRETLIKNLSERFGSSNVSTRIAKMDKYSTKLNRKNFVKKSIDIYADLHDGIIEPEDEYKYRKGYQKIGDKYKKVSRTHAAIDKEQKKIRYPSIVVMCPHKVGELSDEYLATVETFIVDEGHTFISMINDFSNRMPNAMYRYSLSATSWRDRKEDMILMLSTFGNNIIYEETYQEAVRSNKVKNVKYIQENSPTPDEFLRDAKNPDDIIKRGIVGNVARNKVIVERGLEYVSLGRKVMVCVSETDHCEVLKKRFEKQGLTVFDYFSKQDKDFKKDIERLTEDTKGKAGFIVLATVALGIGADTKAIDTVILADVRKASNGLFQRGGRGTRKVDFEAEETLIIHDFDDWFNETTWKWSKIRKKLINEYYFGEGSFTLKVAKKHKIEMRTND